MPKKTQKSKRSKVEKGGGKYKPPEWAWNLLQAFLDPEIKPTVTARCAEANVPQSTFYKALKREDFLHWFRTSLRDWVLSEISDVRQAHLKLCLTGNLEAIKLWYEHYDRFVPTQRVLTGADFDVLSDEALDEIDRILREAKQKGKSTTVH